MKDYSNIEQQLSAAKAEIEHWRKRFSDEAIEKDEALLLANRLKGQLDGARKLVKIEAYRCGELLQENCTLQSKLAARDELVEWEASAHETIRVIFQQFGTEAAQFLYAELTAILAKIKEGEK